MFNFKINDYIEIYNPATTKYFPVRILNSLEKGYEVTLLDQNKTFILSYYQLKRYGFQKIWITDDILKSLSFSNDGYLFNFKEIYIFYCILPKFEKTQDPFFLFGYSSSFLGYRIFKQEDLINFKQDWKKAIDEKNESILESNYTCINEINELLRNSIFSNSHQLEREEIDNLILKKYHTR